MAQGKSRLARSLYWLILQSVVDWPLGKLTYGKTEKELRAMKNEKGFSLIELLIVVAIIGIIAAIAIPNLLKSRQAANEASAIGSVRTLGTSQATYQSTRGKGKDFAADLAALQADGAIDSALGGGTKSGFVFTCAGTASTTAGAPSFFDTSAAPQSTGNFGTGNRWFYSNETYVVYQSSTSAVTVPAGPGTRVPTAPSDVAPLQ
jgi:type IV pilus assembly protein PilA